MGTTVRRLGPLGSGSLAKACNQLIVGTTTAALAEAAELAERSGMDVAALYEVLVRRPGRQPGPGASWARGLPRRTTPPPGPAKFMHKDLSFVVRVGRAPPAPPCRWQAAGVELYAELKRQGLGDQDLAVVRQTISNLSASTALQRCNSQQQEMRTSIHECTF